MLQLQTLQQEKEALDEQHEKVCEKCNGMVQKNEELEVEKQSLKDELEALRMAGRTSMAQILDLEGQKSTLETVLEELTKENGALQQAKVALERENQELQEHAQVTNEELLQMKATHAGVLEDLRLTKEAMTKATEELQEEKKAQSECAQAESRLQEELDAEKKAHSECTDEKKALQSRVQEQGSQMEADAAQIAKLLAKMDLLKKESEEALGALQVQMDKACDERCAAEVRDALAKSEEEHTRVLEEEQARMQKDVDKLSANDMDDATRIATLEGQMRVVTDAHSGIQQELHRLKEAHAAVKEAHAACTKASSYPVALTLAP